MVSVYNKLIAYRVKNVPYAIRRISSRISADNFSRILAEKKNSDSRKCVSRSLSINKFGSVVYFGLVHCHPEHVLLNMLLLLIDLQSKI